MPRPDVEATGGDSRVILDDLRQACRALRQHPLLTTTIVLTLGLGIGANTAVFSVLDAVALRPPLSVPAPDELFSANTVDRSMGAQEGARFSGPEFDLMRRAAPEGVGVAAMSRGIARVYTRHGDERQTTPASLQLVSPDLLTVLGIPTALGRGLSGGTPGGGAVAVLSHGYWRRRFGGAPGVVGSALWINGTAFAIAGVAPRGFVGVWLETPVDLWVPLAMQPQLRYTQSFTAEGADLDRPWLEQPGIWWLHVVLRIPGDRAGAEGALSAALPRGPGGDERLVLQPFARGFSRFRQQFSRPLVALLTMAALVLLIACLNVTNVLLARGIGRRRELAVRVAVGAGRARLLRQLATESALLAALSALAALFVARWAGDLLVRLATATMQGPAPFAASLDLRVLGFTAAVALLAAFAIGVWPAWSALRLDVVAALKAGASGRLGSATRTPRALVALQVAVSLVLVTGAGLFVRSFRNLLDVGLGFEPERLLTVEIDPRLSAAAPEALPETYGRLLEAVAAVPGVESAALAMCGLQGSCAREDGYVVEGRPARSGEPVVFSVNAVSPGYATTLGVRLLAGRDLAESDRAGAAPVALVSRALAASCFGDWQAALGRRLGRERPDLEVVGVVDDVRALGDLRAAPPPSIYVPLAQRPVVPRALAVRTGVDPASAIPGIRRALADAAPQLPIEGVAVATERVRQGLGRERLVVLLTSGFGALAAALAGFGIFGVLSYAVARRTPELGLRLALGASPSRLVRSVVGDALRLVLAGVALGVPFAVLGARLVSTIVFGVGPRDAVSLLAATFVLGGVALVSSVVPARRAARVDPAVALGAD